MVRFFHSGFFPNSRRGDITALSAVLAIGFLSGAFIGVKSAANDCSLLEVAANSCVLFPGLLAVIILPLLLTALAAYTRQTWLLIPIALAKAFIFSYLCCKVLLLYGDSGWLVLAMFMFTDLLSMPFLCWVWIRILIHGPIGLRSGLFAAVLPLLAIAFLDYRFISPYLVNLLS